MTSAQVRQSFLDFFKSKQHSIVQSSSLMPDSPNLLFTNAGMMKLFVAYHYILKTMQSSRQTLQINSNLFLHHLLQKQYLVFQIE